MRFLTRSKARTWLVSSASDVAVLKTDVAILKTDMADVKERVERVEHVVNGGTPKRPRKK